MAVEVNRNHYFLIGMVLLVLGVQFRAVDTYVLTPEFTQVLAERSGHPLAAVNATTPLFTPSGKPVAQKTVKLPDWLGWATLAVGSVLALHALSLRRPE